MLKFNFNYVFFGLGREGERWPRDEVGERGGTICGRRVFWRFFLQLLDFNPNLQFFFLP